MSSTSEARASSPPITITRPSFVSNTSSTETNLAGNPALALGSSSTTPPPGLYLPSPPPPLQPTAIGDGQASTPLHTLLGFMQRRLSDFAGSGSFRTVDSFRSGVEGGGDESALDTGDSNVQHRRYVEGGHLRRAGLLQPMSYNAHPMMQSSSYSSHQSAGHPQRAIHSTHAGTSHAHDATYLPSLLSPPQLPNTTHYAVPPHLHLPSPLEHPADTLLAHTPDSIRAATLELSNMHMGPMSFPASMASGGYKMLSPMEEEAMPAFPSQPPTPQAPQTHDDDSQGFIFPTTTINAEPTGANAETSMGAKIAGLAVPHPARRSSIASLPVNFELEQDDTRSRASTSMYSLVLSTSEDDGSSRLADSIGTLPSLAPSSMPPSRKMSEDEEEAVVKRRGTKEKRKERKKQPSGLSLLRPRPGSSDGSGGSSRSSSSESIRPTPQDNQATASTSTFPPPVPRPTLLHSRQHSAVEETPTATPMGTPRPLGANIPLPASPLTPEDEFPPHRVRWRSPPSLVRTLGASREGSRDVWTRRPFPAHPEAGLLDESTPLLGVSSNDLISYATVPVRNESGDEESGWRPRTILSNLRSRVTGGFANGTGRPENSCHSKKSRWLTLSKKAVTNRVRKEIEHTPHYANLAVKAIPAVLLGCLLNILDGVSYGMIVFPAAGVFSDLGPMGVSMFFVSAVVAQLVYTFGGSGFAGANGSMMIEVVPFFHILAMSISDQIGEQDPASVIATTLAAYTLSSILTGLAFFLLGALKLGVVVGFFPRHILVGCIGGVGAFLIETGLTVSMRISDDDFDYSWETLRYMVQADNFILWALPLSLAIILRLITHKFHHQLIFPLYFIIIPVIFYIVVLAARLDLQDLRHSGWIFDMGSSANEPWYKFYSYFDFGKIRYTVLWSTLPTQFALLFFNILHPPLNVPALSVSLNEDVDTNKELVAHGYSNLLSGLVGSVPNYLVYVNTLLFYRVGGDNRIAGFLLAVATAALLVIGPGPIAFIPVMVVGALIFVLGIDLVKEALWDNRHRVTWPEYITIISIMITMTVWDFVMGVLLGIIVSCIFFVVQNSQVRCIRAIYTGDLAMSAVRRPSVQRAYIREVSKQTTVLRLQGFLFFGTITYVEETIRSLIEGPGWQQHPVQFLVLDLSLVNGVDMSSAEAFVRIQRLLGARCVTLVFCGFGTDSPAGKALRSVNVVGAPGVELFSNFNDAMEWTENAYLRAWFRSQKIETSAISFPVPGRQDADIEYSQLVGSFVRSPRRSHIRDVGERTIATEIFSNPQPDLAAEPLNTLYKTFSSYGEVDPILFQPISDYLERITVTTGAVLWRQGDPSDGLYLIESGILRASYTFVNPSQKFEESMVAGTLAGELSALADAPRNATVVVEHPSVLWKLSGEHIKKLQIEQPELGRVFVQLVLKAAKLDYDILLAAIASRQ